MSNFAPIQFGEAKEYDAPSPELFRELRAQLMALTIVRRSDARRKLEEYDDPEIVALDLDALIEMICSQLTADFLDQSEEAELNGSYFVKCGLSCDFEDDPAGLSVLTILQSNDPSKGRIFYGNAIHRIGDNQFLTPSKYD